MARFRRSRMPASEHRALACLSHACSQCSSTEGISVRHRYTSSARRQRTNRQRIGQERWRDRRPGLHKFGGRVGTDTGHRLAHIKRQVRQTGAHSNPCPNKLAFVMRSRSCTLPVTVRGRTVGRWGAAAPPATTPSVRSIRPATLRMTTTNPTMGRP